MKVLGLGPGGFLLGPSRQTRSLAGLAARLPSLAAPAGSIRPGLAGAAELAALGPGDGQVALGPLAQLGAGFLQDPGAVLERRAQFLPLAGGVGAGLGVLGGRVGQALLGGLPAGDGVGQATGDLLPFPGDRTRRRFPGRRCTGTFALADARMRRSNYEAVLSSRRRPGGRGRSGPRE